MGNEKTAKFREELVNAQKMGLKQIHCALANYDGHQLEVLLEKLSADAPDILQRKDFVGCIEYSYEEILKKVMDGSMRVSKAIEIIEFAETQLNNSR